MEEKEYDYQGLWIKEYNGSKYISGKVKVGGEEYYCNIYKNTKKVEGSKQPDYNLKLKEDKVEFKNSDIFVDIFRALFQSGRYSFWRCDLAARTRYCARNFN